MFFCDPCNKHNGLDAWMIASRGPCEICGEVADCYDVPSSLLPFKPLIPHNQPFPNSEETTAMTTSKNIKPTVGLWIRERRKEGEDEPYREIVEVDDTHVHLLNPETERVSKVSFDRIGRYEIDPDRLPNGTQEASTSSLPPSSSSPGIVAGYDFKNASFIGDKIIEIRARLELLKPYVEEFHTLGNALNALEGSARNNTTTKPDGNVVGRRGRPRGTGHRAQQVIDFIRQNGPSTVSEIAEGIECSSNYLYRVVPELRKDGKLIKSGNSWALPEA